MSSLVDYDLFVKKHSLRKVVNFHSDEMDIVKAKSAMNVDHVVFNKGDYIITGNDPKEHKILAFAARDNDYFGAIVKVKDGIARFVNLEDAINTTFESEMEGTMIGLLYQYGLRPSTDGYVKKCVCVDVIDDDCATVWRLDMNGEEYSVVKENINYTKLEKMLKMFEKKNTWDKHAKSN
jgi:hypothetical protein